MRNKGASYEEAGCFAAAMSTIKLEKSGPFSGTEEEVWHILKNNKQKPEVLVAQYAQIFHTNKTIKGLPADFSLQPLSYTCHPKVIPSFLSDRLLYVRQPDL